MATPRITTLNIGGLVTTPGKGAYPPGSCSRLKNFRFIGTNRLQGMWKFGAPTNGGLSGGTPVKQIELSNNKFAVVQSNNTTICYGGNITSQPYTVPSYYSTMGFRTNGFLSNVVSRARLLVNSENGIYVSDYVDPDFSDASQRAFRSAGMPQPQITRFTAVAGLSVTNQVICSYQAVFRRDYLPTDYSIKSIPSVTQLVWNNTGATADYVLRINWAYSDDIRVGDTVEIYRSLGVIATGYTAAFDVGSQGFLVAAAAVTSTDATNKYIDIHVTQLMGQVPGSTTDYSSTGATIYTDTTQEGPAQADNPPPNALAVCNWKGMTWYANFADAPVQSFTAKAYVGLLTASWDRQNGIGVRLGSGVITTSGSNITGVSAADMVGIKTGQYWVGDASVFPSTARVIGTSGSTIFMGKQALTSSHGWAFADSVRLNGVEYRTGWLGDLVQSVGTSGTFGAVASLDVYSEAASQAGVTVTVQPQRYSPAITVSATNAQNYNEAITETLSGSATVTAVTSSNLARFSKVNQPEAVPTTNEVSVGFGSIIALAPLTDFLFAFCTDGLWVINGPAGGPFTVEQWDQSLLISGPQAVTVMNDKCFAITNRGFASVDPVNRVQTISSGMFDELTPARVYTASPSPQLVCDVARQETWLLYAPTGLTAQASTIYIWNEQYKQLYEYDLTNTGTAADAYVRSLGINSGDSTFAPAITLTLYSGTLTRPNYAVIGTSGTPLTCEAFLREMGDAMTIKQWNAASWIFDRSSFTENVLGTWNFPLGAANSADTVSTGIDRRARLGCPRQQALRPELKVGMKILAPQHAVELLGVSLEVVPQTTQSENR